MKEQSILVVLGNKQKMRKKEYVAWINQPFEGVKGDEMIEKTEHLLEIKAKAGFWFCFVKETIAYLNVEAENSHPSVSVEY